MSLRSASPHLKCAGCGYTEPMDGVWTECPQCGEDWIDAVFDYDRVAQLWPEALKHRPPTMWRYRELLHLLDDDHLISMGEGYTPLLPAVNLRLMLGAPNIYLKDERQGPTGSFKDRQASLSISRMKELGIKEAVVASTGNVAISYSAYSALAGIKMWAFLTGLVPPEKMREVALYGSEVVKVTGTYDQTKKVAAQFASRKNLFKDRGIRSISARESMKTVAFEIAEQLAEVEGPGDEGPWRTPDWYIQAVSGGMGPVGVWKGYEELLEMGLVDRLPKLACIQAAGCAPMVHSFEKGLEEPEPVLNPQTRVITIATGNPGPAYGFLSRVIREHGGTFEAVTDEEIYHAMHVMAKLDGLSMETAAATAFAGLFKLLNKGTIKRDEIVVVNCSGHTFPVEKHLLGEDWAQTVEWPAMEEEQAEAEKTPAAARPRPAEEGLLGSLEQIDERVRRIAILEDNPQAALLLRRILQTRGDYQILEAHDGREGLDMIQRHRPDLILLDLMMPEMDGFAVLEALKTDEELNHIPVVVITAKELTAAERKRLGGQIEALMQKGDFTDEDLLEEILNQVS